MKYHYPQQHPEEQTLQVYNALDCCITHAVFAVIHPQLDEVSESIYSFERGLQRAALNIMLRGVLIDPAVKLQKILDAERRRLPLEKQWRRLCEGTMGRSYNVNSPAQMAELFYSKMGAKVILNRATGRPTVDDKALDKIRQGGGAAGFFARYVATLRALDKTISTLRQGTDPDGRMREGINITGTETGRWSSSKPSYGGLGMSGQNITESLRDMFIADPGYVFIYVDLDQAESRVVGLVSFRDSATATYLEACESGDIHTAVCKMTWPEIEWGLDARAKAEKEMLNEQFSYRDVAKRLGHGTNYLGTPGGMSHAIKIPKDIVADFQRRYFAAFPDIKQWHEAVVRKLQLDRSLTTLLGRRRFFFDRAYELGTIKEAIAYEPQSVVGDLTNRAIYRLAQSETVRPLKNLHDGALLQVKEADLEKGLALVKEAFHDPLVVGERSMVIPCEIRTGWNWGKHGESNPNGLALLGAEERKRKERLPILSLRV